MSSENEIKLSSYVDTDFIAKAESDICGILLSQRRAFNQRWHHQKNMNKIKVVLRYVGMILCLAGLLVLVAKGPWRLTNWQTTVLLVFFLAGVVFFYLLPAVEKKLQGWTDRVSQKSCKKLAKKCVKQADKMCPFEAVYEIKGSTISYYRKQPSDQTEDQWQFVWNRAMNDYALQSEHATVFFKNPKAIQPRIIVLHTDRKPLAAALKKLGIDTTPSKGAVA